MVLEAIICHFPNRALWCHATTVVPPRSNSDVARYLLISKLLNKKFHLMHFTVDTFIYA